MTVQQTKNKIISIVTAFETGSAVGDYGQVSIYNDGKSKSRQITFGKLQTTEQGNLKQLIQMYCDSKGLYKNEFLKYLPIIGITPLVDSDEFVNLLKQSIQDPIMIKVQNDFFDLLYYKPAVKWFVDNGFKQRLSLLVIFDSFVHSGRIRTDISKKISIKTPVNEAVEKQWITQYVNLRQKWLSNKSRDLSLTIYRTKCFKQIIANNDWDLELPVIANGVKVF